MCWFEKNLNLILFYITPVTSALNDPFHPGDQIPYCFPVPVSFYTFQMPTITSPSLKTPIRLCYLEMIHLLIHRGICHWMLSAPLRDITEVCHLKDYRLPGDRKSKLTVMIQCDGCTHTESSGTGSTQVLSLPGLGEWEDTFSRN